MYIRSTLAAACKPKVFENASTPKPRAKPISIPGIMAISIGNASKKPI
jgi:hypothetical protein